MEINCIETEREKTFSLSLSNERGSMFVSCMDDLGESESVCRSEGYKQGGSCREVSVRSSF